MSPNLSSALALVTDSKSSTLWLAKRRRSYSPDDEEPAAKRARSTSPELVESKTARGRSPANPERKRGLAQIKDRPDDTADWEASLPLSAACALPLEVLHEIFDIVIPPEYMLNNSLHCGPNSAWCQAMVTKRALTSVCNSWYLAGVHFLYRHISLRRVTDVKALLRTLSAKPELGPLVRTIEFICYVPDDYRHDIDPDMTRILELCPSVTAVHELVPFLCVIGGVYGNPSHHRFPALPSTITSLKFGQDESISPGFLSAYSDRLEELWIYAYDDERFDGVEMLFSKLHTLHVTFHGRVKTKTFASKWQMPQLKRMTFRIDTQTSPKGDQLAESYKRILALHGATLGYLAFPGFYSATTRHEQEEKAFGEIIALCPVLEHLVVPGHCFVSPTDYFPTVKYLDIWRSDLHTELPMPHTTHTRILVHDAVATVFLNLCNVRLIDTALIPIMGDVPSVFDRDLHDSWSMVYPGLSVRQDRQILDTNDRVVCYEPPRRVPGGWPMPEEEELVPARPPTPEHATPVSIIQLTDIHVVKHQWSSTDFGTREIESVLRDQEKFKEYTSSKDNAAIIERRQQIRRRPRRTINSDYGILIAVAVKMEDDTEPEDEYVFQDALHCFPKFSSNDDGSEPDSEDSWGSIESEDENALVDEFYHGFTNGS
ncbi:hypothetical protein C8R43DRAFT_586760 [Mycena crocata]|nr:hypothetical protein C8R43DRAFT_586760 [Mycena crocata]